MIEWIKYGSVVPDRLKLYLVSGGLWVSFGMHQFDDKDRVYRWIAGDGEPLDGVTHFAEINYPTK